MKKTNILLVEDEETLGQIVKESLETRNFEVTYVQDGLAAETAFFTQKPELCILDVMLPGKDGFSLAKSIRREDPHIPIIFLTARSQTADVVRGFELGADDYLKKPFSMEELIVRIHALLRRGRSPVPAPVEESPQLPIGNYEFDPVLQTLSLQGKARKLTHRESALLRLLFQHRKEVLDRKTALEALWGDDSFFNARSMDVFISKLRKYLREDPQVEIINVRGVGYKLVC
jgi:DNA-binding response OmpR family regulator